MSEDERISHQILELRAEIQELKDIVSPIAETYRTASTIGVWSKGFLVFVSVTISIALGFRNLLNK